MVSYQLETARMCNNLNLTAAASVSSEAQCSEGCGHPPGQSGCVSPHQGALYTLLRLAPRWYCVSRHMVLKLIEGVLAAMAGEASARRMLSAGEGATVQSSVYNTLGVPIDMLLDFGDRHEVQHFGIRVHGSLWQSSIECCK